VVALLDNRASMNARMSEGGTATVRTLEQVESLKVWLCKQDIFSNKYPEFCI